MRIYHAFFAACAIGFVGYAGAEAKELSWSRISSPDGAFSVETPCSADEVERAKSLPADVIVGVSLPQASRVICMNEGVILVAGVIEEPALSKGSPPLFDQFMIAAQGDSTAEGTPSLTSIDGRRAYLNRQESEDVVAQTGLVELGRAKIIFAIGSGKSGSVGLDQSDKIRMIDHFYRSVRIGGK